MTNRTAAKARAARAQPPPSRKPPVLAIALGALAVVVAVGVIIAVAGSGDEGDGGSGSSDAVFGPVAVEGDPLPASGAEPDPAVGLAAPVLTGETPGGAAITVGGAGEPTVIAFLAHWCPHCQAELPVLVDVEGAGGFEGVRTVAVLTGTNPDAPNFPPTEWLEDEGWPGEVFLDDEAQTAAQAYGLTSYPLLVALDADGNVVGRTVGEQPQEEVEALAAAARGEPT